MRFYTNYAQAICCIEIYLKRSRICRGWSLATPRHFWNIFQKKSCSTNTFKTYDMSTGRKTDSSLNTQFQKVDLRWQLWLIRLRQYDNTLILLLQTNGYMGASSHNIYIYIYIYIYKFELACCSYCQEWG